MKVFSLSVDRTKVSVSGVNTVPVTLTLEASIPEGRGQDLTVEVDEVVDGKSKGLDAQFPLRLVSGTPERGTWRGVLLVPGPSRTLDIRAVYGCDINGNACGGDDGPTPIDVPLITVEASHAPRLTVASRPSPVPASARSYVLYGRVVDTQTGKGMSGVNVVTARGEGCFYPRPVVTTKADGSFSTTLSNVGQKVTEGSCNYIASAAKDVQGQPVNVISAVTRVQWTAPVPISAPTSVRRPGPITVTGRGAGVWAQWDVSLQRLRGATQWRTVGTAKVRVSGRYSVTAPATVLGRGVYRVVATAPSGSGVSKTVTITVR